jgi:hypothetical protein
MIPFPILTDSRSDIIPSELAAAKGEMPYLIIKYIISAITTPTITHIIYLL